MLLANDCVGDKIYPTRYTDAYCPFCGGKMQYKCGKIMVWHWAHKVHNENCIYKPETQWHLKWKKYGVDSGCKVEHRIGNNITDVVISGTRVLELQHSGITANEIKERCSSYGSNGYHTDWLFDMRDKYKKDQLDLRINGDFFTFVQKWKKSTINTLFNDRGRPTHGKVWFDFGVEGEVFFVKKLHENGNGWGFIKPKFDVFYPVPQRWW